MSTGRIIKGIGGFYYVLPDAGGEPVSCKARGHFRIQGLTPTVGDLVTYSMQQDGTASIETISPRKNILVRPAVSNIDLLLIVLSASVPEPSWILADRLIIQAKMLGVEPVLVLNKCDAPDPEILRQFDADYSGHFRTLRTSAKNGDGLDELKSVLQDRISCFAGQSAVGKSSLLNALIPGLDLETGSLSAKTDRGKHTTRRAELWPAFGGAILDTPGFSLFESAGMEQADLNRCYPEFSDLPGKCRFQGCMHLTEPDCAVKEMVARGGMSRKRYERYGILAKEFEEGRKHRYD